MYFLFAQSIFCRILLNALLIGFRSAGMKLVEIFVLFKGGILLFARKKVYRNVGAVVGYPLHIGEDINKVYADLNLAYTALSPVDMYRFKLLHQPVHDLLKGSMRIISSTSIVLVAFMASEIISLIASKVMFSSLMASSEKLTSSSNRASAVSRIFIV